MTEQQTERLITALENIAKSQRTIAAIMRCEHKCFECEAGLSKYADRVPSILPQLKTEKRQ
jgi:hypothetical protein